MRSKFLVAILTISLGLMTPVVSAIVFPDVVIAQTVEERRKEADRFLDLGSQQLKDSQIDEALKSWQQALKIYREIKNRRGEGYALGALGIAYYSLGNYLKAIDYQEQGLAIASEIKDRRGESVILRSLGSMYRAVGDTAKADNYEAKGIVLEVELTGKVQW